MFVKLKFVVNELTQSKKKQKRRLIFHSFLNKQICFLIKLKESLLIKCFLQREQNGASNELKIGLRLFVNPKLV